MTNVKINNLIKTLGPGIMFAGTCIGGSHLVQSTRAGADYGFELLAVILLANLFKYPFFEFASRYANATGKSILHGFKKEGNWTLFTYGIITFLSMFIVTGSIVLVTGGLLGNLLKIDAITTIQWVLIVVSVVWAILALGKFGLLDSTLKVIGLVLLLSVVVATILLLSKGRPEPIESFQPKQLNNMVAFGFVIGLMGWMPMGVDMSAWGSIWTEERIKQTGYHPTLKETLIDFNFGYFVTVILAFCFLTLGAYVFYGSGKELPSGAIAYSDMLVSLFTSSIGEWSYVIIALATFSTMFGTSLTLVDGYTRTMDKITELLKNDTTPSGSKKRYWIWSSIVLLGGFLIVYASLEIKNEMGEAVLSFKELLNTATIISFVIAPLAAYLNYRIVFAANFPETHKPPKWLKILSIAGIVFLSGITITYIASFFFDFF